MEQNFLRRRHMRPSKSELIKQHIDSFPVLPMTVTRLMQVTANPDCSVKEIVDTIHTDQSLCLTILKIANSVLFGRPQKVDSIKMAVVILGFNEVQNIALTKALINSFSKLTRQHRQLIDRFWQHCFLCGMAARIIARKLRMNPDTAFMGGLLHDIGKLIMLQTFGEDYTADCWMIGLSSVRTLHDELQNFSFTHDILGGQLLEKWLFPENLITAVVYHHRPEEARRENILAQIIQIADILSFYCCNRELLNNDEIAPALFTALPLVQSQWAQYGRTLDEDMVSEWFHWLVTNHDQSSTLKAAFSS